jgi:hypothetical protein
MVKAMEEVQEKVQRRVEAYQESVMLYGRGGSAVATD